MSSENLDDDFELPTLTGEGGCDVISRNGEFINNSSKPIRSIKCLIDEEIVNRVRDLQAAVERKLRGSNEFGGYVKWHWDEKGNVVVDDFMIPKQTVGGATVDFHSPADPEYTGVFHKHPNGCKSFSGTDDTYINSNNDLSILFEGGNFITGIVNIPLPDSSARLQVKLNIVQFHRTRKEVDVSMIDSCASSFRVPAGFTETVRMPPASLPSLSKGAGSLEDFMSDDEDDALPFLGD